MIIAIGISLIIGMLIGRFFDVQEDCPRVIRGYSCHGDYCDHGDVAYFQACLDMAKVEEQRERDENKNLWRGDN